MIQGVSSNKTGATDQRPSEGNKATLASLAGTVNGVALPKIENLSIQNAENVKVFVQVNDKHSYTTRFLQGMATAAGGAITTVAVFKVAECVYGIWRGGTAGAAVGGPAGAIAGAVAGGTMAFIA